MFDTLSEKLGGILDKLTRRGALREADVDEAMREVRRALLEQATREGWEAMHQRLATIDPIASKRIHPNDTQRIQRALEVHA